MLFMLAAGNASEWTGPTGNNTYLVTGPVSALIDAGVGHRQHLDAIEERLGPASLDLVLLTHHHVDHVAGVPQLLERWPNAIVRGGGQDAFLDGEVIEAGGTRLRTIHTPGHAPDHFCFLDESSRDLFCGDLARLGGTVVIPASKGGNLRDYLRSLERVRDLRPTRMLPAHGPVIDEPARLVGDYLEHRYQREQQVLAALADGCRTPSEIVARIYTGLPPSLRSAAEETVRAHLQKLFE